MEYLIPEVFKEGRILYEIDQELEQQYLRNRIRAMKRGDEFFKILKEELSALGYWKNKPRGNPRAGYEKSKFGRG
jgi:hypothetical protein